MRFGAAHPVMCPLNTTELACGRGQSAGSLPTRGVPWERVGLRHTGEFGQVLVCDGRRSRLGALPKVRVLPDERQAQNAGRSELGC